MTPLRIPANLPDYSRQWLALLDEQAMTLGAKIAASQPAAEDLNAYGREVAARLALDPRVAAIPSLAVAGRGDGGVQAFFVGQYSRLLHAQLRETAR